MDSLQALGSQVTHLTEQLPATLPPPVTPEPPVSTVPPVAPGSPAPPPSLPREPFVPVPEPFLGKIGHAKGFMLRCSLVFSQQPSSYPTDQAKIAYVINLLRDRAAQFVYFLMNCVECLITRSLSRHWLRSYFPFLRAFSLLQIFLLISALLQQRAVGERRS